MAALWYLDVAASLIPVRVCAGPQVATLRSMMRRCSELEVRVSQAEMSQAEAQRHSASAEAALARLSRERDDLAALVTELNSTIDELTRCNGDVAAPQPSGKTAPTTAPTTAPMPTGGDGELVRRGAPL